MAGPLKDGTPPTAVSAGRTSATLTAVACTGAAAILTGAGAVGILTAAAVAGTGATITGLASAVRTGNGTGLDSTQILPMPLLPERLSTKLIRLPRLVSAASNKAWASAQKAWASRACSRAERLAALVLKVS